MSTVAESTPVPTVQSWSVWQIDPRHSLAEFSVRHMMLSRVRGRFTGVSGTIVDAAEDPKYSSVKAELDVTTLITGDPQRDEHLRSADFFDVAKLTDRGRFVPCALELRWPVRTVARRRREALARCAR